MPKLETFLSNDTQAAINETINQAIHKYSVIYQIEEALIRAFIRQESEGKFNALRYEPHLERAEWYLKSLGPFDKTNKYAYFSMGLMQILFGTAKSMGFGGKPFDLMEPDNSINYGCKFLKSLLRKHAALEDAVSSYNQGSPKKGKDGKYLNQEYVDRVMRNLAAERNKQTAGGPP